MTMTAAQIVSNACQVARVPGYTSQAGILLNSILSELCQNYNFEAARKLYQFTFNNGVSNGQGPYPLPADYLRAAKDEVFYSISGVPYVMISIDLAEYDRLVQTAGFSGYPNNFATDLSVSPVNLYVWPPASGGYPVNLRYYSQMPDIATPETSSAVPWFLNDNYLCTRLAGELMKLSDDERKDAYLGDGPTGAQGILLRYLKLKDDDEGRVKTVDLDRRRFGKNWSSLPNTKTVGW